MVDRDREGVERVTIRFTLGSEQNNPFQSIYHTKKHMNRCISHDKNLRKIKLAIFWP